MSTHEPTHSDTCQVLKHLKGPVPAVVELRIVMTKRPGPGDSKDPESADAGAWRSACQGCSELLHDLANKCVGEVTLSIEERPAQAPPPNNPSEEQQCRPTPS